MRWNFDKAKNSPCRALPGLAGEKSVQTGFAVVMCSQQPLCYSFMAAGIHILVLLWTLPLPFSHRKDPSARYSLVFY